MKQSDTALVAAAQAGDKAAFGALVDRHLPAACRTAVQLVHEYDLACELVQEAVLQVYLSYVSGSVPMKERRFGCN